jgi:hypothetical protein
LLCGVADGVAGVTGATAGSDGATEANGVQASTSDEWQV